jgi:hypothetical protein
VPAGNFYAWLFVTFGFSLLTRWLREAAHRRRRLEWLQLLVPIPAFGLLLLPLAPFMILHPLVDPGPGGGWPILGLAMAVFLGVSGWAVWGPDRGRPDGAADAIIDLRLAHATRLAIHLVFLAAFVGLGMLDSVPLLGVVAVALLALELPIGILAHRRLGAAERRRDADRHATVNP